MLLTVATNKLISVESKWLWKVFTNSINKRPNYNKNQRIIQTFIRFIKAVFSVV